MVFFRVLLEYMYLQRLNKFYNECPIVYYSSLLADSNNHLLIGTPHKSSAHLFQSTPANIFLEYRMFRTLIDYMYPQRLNNVITNDRLQTFPPCSEYTKAKIV